MNCYKKNIIYCEGQTEKKLLQLLGVCSNVQVYNLIERPIKAKIRTLNKTVSHNIFIIFDTDTNNFITLIENIELLIKQKNVTVYLLQQNPNLEGELSRCCKTKNIHTLIGCKSKSDFKSDFCQCNNANKLISQLDFSRLWTSNLHDALQRYNTNQINYHSFAKLIKIFKQLTDKI